MNRQIPLVLAAVAVGAAGTALVAQPAGAETYEGDCLLLGTVPVAIQFEIAATGPQQPVAPGATFTLSDLTAVYQSDPGTQAFDGVLTVLGQTIDMGDAAEAEGVETFGPLDIGLVAPASPGVVDLRPESFAFVESVFPASCTFPDALPFASVTVQADQPPVTTPPTQPTPAPAQAVTGVQPRFTG